MQLVIVITIKLNAKNLIVFSGLDGAGKSTQIDLLKAHYEKQGIQVKYFWSRGGYTPGIQGFKNLLRKSSSKKMFSQGPSKERDQSFSNPLVRKVWLSLAILDLVFFYGIYVRFKSFTGVKVICDRYIIDTSIDFRLNFPDENVDKWLIWKSMVFIAMRPKKHFVFTIPVEESLRRSKQKEEPFPDSEETLKTRLNDYLVFIDESSNVIHVDGTKKIDDISDFILEQVKK